MKKNRTLIVTIAVLVVAGGAVYAVTTGLYPPKSGTEGAIGAATRYQAQQISDADVSLTDASVQTFLQSDTFYKIATNPVFRKQVIENAKAITTFYQNTKLELLDGAEVAELMNDSKLLNAAASDELFKKAVEQAKVQEFAKAIVAAKKSKAENQATAAELAKASEVLQQAGVTSDLENKSKLFFNKGFAEMLAKGQATELLNDTNLLELLSESGLAEMFNDSSLQSELMGKNVIDALKKAPPEVLRSATATVHPRSATSTVNPRSAKATSHPRSAKSTEHP